MEKNLNILMICGSLRKTSYNRSLLHACESQAPKNMTFEFFDIGKIPLYNQDVFDQGMPSTIAEFRQKIADADALLIASPEYNYSFTGVLKNALDWASRPPSAPTFAKHAALVGATMGTVGTARGQMHLRQVCQALNLLTMNTPEVLLSQAHEKFDASGKLIDEKTEQHLAKFMRAFLEFIQKTS